MLFNVQSSDMRLTVDADSPDDAGRKAVKEFLGRSGERYLATLTVISTDGWPGDDRDFIDDDYLISTEVLLKQVGCDVVD